MKKDNKDTGVRESAAPAELTPLTDKLYTDFSIEALEERLETDPLLLSGLFEEITPYCDQCKKSDLTCGKDNCAKCNGPGAIYNDSCGCNTIHGDIEVDPECFKIA